MKHRVKLGVICLARKTFDYNAALEIYEKKQSELSKRIDIEFVFYPGLVIEVEDAKKAAQELLKHDVDAYICISGTFHLGHLVLEIQKKLQKPVLLWGWNELPYNGGKIRLNSVCGVNLNASNLYKSGIKNYQVVVGENLDENWIDAIRIISRYSNAHVGLIGYRAHGFFNLGVYDLNVYKELGILIDHYELDDLYHMAVSDTEIQEQIKEVKEIFDCSGITEDQVLKVATLTVKMSHFVKLHKVDALAVRCWPEFAANFGISPCAAMSILQSKGLILSCEGDVEGALSMLAHQAIGAETPYLFDFSQVNFEEDYALLWHCGVAPCNLWNKKCTRSLDTYFAGGKGVTADFVLKSGELSIFRMDSAGTDIRLFVQKATAVDMEKELRGTYAKAVFDEGVQAVLDRVVENGVAHHASLVYGDFIKPFEILGKIKNWRII